MKIYYDDQQTLTYSAHSKDDDIFNSYHFGILHFMWNSRSLFYKQNVAEDDCVSVESNEQQVLIIFINDVDDDRLERKNQQNSLCIEILFIPLFRECYFVVMWCLFLVMIYEIRWWSCWVSN